MSEEKLLGFFPKAKYVQFAYMFLLVSAAGNALYALFGAVGINIQSGTLGVVILGLLAVILSIVGLSLHRASFTALDRAHFIYIIVLFVAFLVLNILFGGVYIISPTLGFLATTVLGLLQAALVWTGYNAWQGGRVLRVSTFKSEIQIALKKR